MAYLYVESYPNALNCVVGGLDTTYAYERGFVWQASLNGALVVYETTIEQPHIATASYTMSGLTPGLTYQIEVDIYSYNGGWGELFAKLDGSGVPASPTKGSFIYANGEWKKATPYIYATKNGVTKWWPATAKIYDGGQWK